MEDLVDGEWEEEPYVYRVATWWTVSGKKNREVPSPNTVHL